MLCDGMILASPAGSTAYNLSCDGPLVVWDAEALVLNFIAPHSIGFRPLVLRADHVIRVHNARLTDAAEIMADGRRRRTGCRAAITSRSRAGGSRAACSCAKAIRSTATSKRSSSNARLMLVELAIDDLVLITRREAFLRPRSERDHRRDRRRQDAARPGHRPAARPEGRRGAWCAPEPIGRSSRRCSPTADDGAGSSPSRGRSIAAAALAPMSTGSSRRPPRSRPR